MKRYSRQQIREAMKEGSLLEVTGFAKTKYIEIINSDYNREIAEKNGTYSHMDCACYDKDRNFLSIFKLGNFIQVWK